MGRDRERERERQSETEREREREKKKKDKDKNTNTSTSDAAQQLGVPPPFPETQLSRAHEVMQGFQKQEEETHQDQRIPVPGRKNKHGSAWPLCLFVPEGGSD